MEPYTDSDAGPSRPRRSPASSTESIPTARFSDDEDLPNSPPKYDETYPTDRQTLLNDAKTKPDDGEPSGIFHDADDLAGLGNHDRMGSPRIPDGGTVKGLASIEQKKALWWRNVIVTGMFICSWYAFATLLSLYNKWMFTPAYYNFPYPLFVTFCHMLVQFSLAGIIRLTMPNKFRPPERPSRQEYVSKIVPTAVSTVGDIGLSNLSLKIITLSLYTMAKSSALLFVLLFAFLFRIETYSLRLLLVILLISFGVFLMVFNTTSVSVPGLIMVFSASGLSGLRWALTELVMHKTKMGLSNPFATIFWLAPIMAVSIGAVSMIAEGWFNVLRSEHFQGIQAIQTVLVIIFPGALAFAMVASEYFIIHRAGSVPLSIAGIFKEVTTISISALVFGDQLNQLNIIGVVITISGICVYTYHKYQKSMSEPIPLDEDGKPLDPEHGGEAHLYARTPIQQSENIPLTADRTSETYTNGHQMASLPGRAHGYPPNPDEAEEEIIRRRNEFEDWNQDEEWSDAEEELDPDEVAARRIQRRNSEGEGRGESAFGRSWGQWWDKEI